MKLWALLWLGSIVSVSFMFLLSYIVMSDPHDQILKNKKQPNLVNFDTTILMCGGTDGSGTRAVVQLLTNIGAPMLIEDRGTMDIHAKSAGGWTKIAGPIVQTTKRLDYDLSKLSPELRTSSMSAISSLMWQLIRSLSTPKYKKGGAIEGIGRYGTQSKYQTAVTAGFKAPIAMATIPIWMEIGIKLKFLQITRDGRDIAFSENQSPVRKYYHLMYGDNITSAYNITDSNSTIDSLRPEERAIRLWSDWNTQVHQLSTILTENSRFSYHNVRIEDLVSEDIKVRYETMKSLASFIGSTVSDEDLCCISVIGTKKKKTSKISKKRKGQYGKWRDLLANRKELKLSLEKLGKEGLALFGYEPQRNVTSFSKASHECEKKEKLCRKKKPSASFEVKHKNKKTTVTKNNKW